MNKEQRPFKFLCGKHRQALIQNPKIAKKFWAEAILVARQQLQHKNFLRAVNIFGNATEVAEILFYIDVNRRKSEIRLSRTAVEYSYVMRYLRCNHEGDCLLSSISNIFDSDTLTQNVDHLLSPLEESMSCSKDVVDRWISARTA